MKRWMLACFAVLSLLLIVASPIAAAPGGNSAGAAACENGGYSDYTDAKGVAFRNEGQCTKYATQGGYLKSVSFLTVAYQRACEEATCPVNIILTGAGLQPFALVTAKGTRVADGMVLEQNYGVVSDTGAISTAGLPLSFPCGTVTDVTFSTFTRSGAPIQTSEQPPC